MPRLNLDKESLFEYGVARVGEFCELNGLMLPAIVCLTKEEPFACIKTCAWYRANRISIKIWGCANIGTAGRAWSFPGYTTDRTPYGVLAHELGHHVDVHISFKKGLDCYNYSGDYCKQLKETTKEPPLTSYCPNPAEWFAEMFRLFLTNPDLLSKLRPKTYEALREHFTPVEKRNYTQVLANAPERTIKQATKKITERSLQRK